MTAEAPEAAPADPQPQAVVTVTPQDDADKPLGEAGERALTAEREARKAADKRAKDADKRAGELEKELNQFRQSSMTESEKALVQARNEARSETLKEVGVRLARTEFKAAAAAKGVDVSDIAQFIDMSQFLDGDGEPDVSQIETAVAAITPKQPEKPQYPSFDNGVRTTAAPIDSSPGGLLSAAFAQDMRTKKTT